MRYLLIDRIILVALEKNIPINMKGMPNPKEYANRRLNESAGDEAARVRIVPKIGPTQGVHPAANANPNKNDNG